MDFGRMVPVSTLSKDFVLHIDFRVIQGAPLSVNLALGESGPGRRGLDLFLQAFGGDCYYSACENYAEGIMQLRTDEIVKRSKLPDRVLIACDPKGRNTLSVKRVDRQISYFLNGRLVATFSSRYFPVQAIGLGVAGTPGKPAVVEFESIESREPR